MLRPLAQDDLNHLVCSVCHQPLILETPVIRCTGCARLYPIVDNLAVLLPARATLKG